MKHRILHFSLLAAAFAGLFQLSSCVRERDTDVSVAEQQVMGEFIYSNALEIADDAATKKTGENLSNFKTSGYCASITHDDVSMPRIIIIDFGPINCMCNDGRNRKGKIVVSYTGNQYLDSNGEVSIKFDQYFVNDYQVFGTKTVTNRGHNLLGQPYYDIKVAGKFLKPNVLDTLVWNADRIRTWTQGSETPVWGDDVYEWTGTGNGMNEFKMYYSMVISKPLVKEQGCRYVQKGKIELQAQGKAMISLDYGDGNCDTGATVLMNNKSYHIEL